MLEIVLLLFLSSGCAGVFEGTRMLGSVERAFTSLCRRIGRFPAMAVASVLSCAVFCNQTIGIIMCRQCMAPNYPDSDAGREGLMLDIENSVVVIAGLVPVVHRLQRANRHAGLRSGRAALLRLSVPFAPVLAYQTSAARARCGIVWIAETGKRQGG